MNLLIDAWIPIQQSGVSEKITMQQLLCGEKEGELCLPRDDMEFACLQLLIALTQVLFTPVSKKELVQRIKQPLTQQEYTHGCEGKLDWFDLNHPETPFMQFRGVKITNASLTSLDKLLPGLNDGQSKAFVNPHGMGDCLCESCAGIALYHYANNCPNMGGGPGGGIKSGLRGNSPVSTLVKRSCLLEDIWLNVLTLEFMSENDLHNDFHGANRPNYICRITPNSKVYPHEISLERGLFWSPVRFELGGAFELGRCSSCGYEGRAFTFFRKEPFGYTLEGLWEHPFSPKFFTTKKGRKEYFVPSISSEYPSWPMLGKFISKELDGKFGYQCAPVVEQAKKYFPGKTSIAIGGFKSSKAMIESRCFETYSLADGWTDKTVELSEMIDTAIRYKDALSLAMRDFANGKKYKNNPELSFSGVGIDLSSNCEKYFFQQTENLIHDALATIDFEHPQQTLQQLYASLKCVVIDLFNQAIAPYQQEPKMLKALASSRRLLHKYLKDLEPQGGNHESAKTA